MKKKLVALIPYAAVFAVIFYLLPMIIRNTGAAMLTMLFVIPFLTFTCALIYGVRQGFDLLLPITAVILFAPSIFIFYNPSAWIYIVAYGLIALIGTGIGRIFFKKR